MEFLRRAIDQIKTQLGNLTTSQRMVIVLLVVVMGGSVLWMVNYSSKRVMVPLLDQPFTEEEQQKIVAVLESRSDQRYEIKGDRVMVPREDQRKLIALCSFNDALPRDTSLGWSLLLEDTDVFAPESVRRDKKLIAGQIELANTIAMWPGVEKAQVFINEGGKRRLSMHTPPASAAVSVQLGTGTPSLRKLALSIANLVSAANARMKRENVKVIVDGQSIPIPNEGDAISGEIMVIKAQAEQNYREKIISVLPMAGALVQVDVTIDNTKSEEKVTKVAKEDEGTLIYTTETTSRQSPNISVSNKQEVGVVSNTVTPNPAAGAAQNEPLEDTTTTKQAIPGTTNIIKHTPAGGITDITATVSIPLSYFENMAQSESGDNQQTDAKPDPKLVQQVTTREIPKIKKSVMLALGLKGPEFEDNVAVDTYWADGSIASSATALAGQVGDFAGGGSIGGVMQRYGTHVAVSVLAVFSLFMVLMMVRKASGPVTLDESETTVLVGGKKPPDALGLEESNLDDENGGGLLSGLELDGNEVRTQQMLEQIRDMVKEAPESAAGLVTKWIKQKD
jgi:flagellar M-ring protein FliF